MFDGEKFHLIGPDGGSLGFNDLWFFSAEDSAANSKQAEIPIQPRIIDTEAKLTELVQKLQQFTNPIPELLSFQCTIGNGRSNENPN